MKSRAVPNELALIETVRRQAGIASRGSRALRLGIGDDCAVLRPSPRHEICVTTDFSLENVHFRRDWHPPESVGHRCLARGLSDLAAMGADPLAVFLSLALPAKLPQQWLDGFLRGFLALAARHNVPLAGGDTAQSPSIQPSKEGLIYADIIAVGQVPQGKALLRSGARPGDLLYVTGALGGAAAELRTFADGLRRSPIPRSATPDSPHFYPEPRLAVGRRLRGIATAMIDLSDGLSTDLTHLCQESKVRAVLDEATLSIHPLAAERDDPRSLALHGGEDYELLFSAPPSTRIPREIAGVAVHRIGLLRRQDRRQPLILLENRGKDCIPVEAEGWQHFTKQTN